MVGPGVVCVVGACLSFTTLAIDKANDYQLVSAALTGGPDAALAILSTVATSMVSLTALVLTIVLVVVQLAMGQFSPRIVQRLLRDRPSQFAIGLFVATFVHTLLAIREVDPGDPGEPGQVPGVAVIATFVLSLASIAVLVMYVHHVGSGVANLRLVELAGGDTRRLLDKVYPDTGPSLPDRVDPQTLVARKSGVLITVAHHQLVQTAHDGGCALELVPALGDFVPAGGVLFKIVGDPAGWTGTGPMPGSCWVWNAPWIRTLPTACGCWSTWPSGRCRIPVGRTRPRLCRPSTGSMTACGSSPTGPSPTGPT